jgi:uncharacterized protein (DUF2141 family)
MSFKTLSCLGLFWVFISNFTAAQYALEIEVTGIKNNEGKIMLQLLGADQKVVSQLMSEISDKKSTISVKNLNPGKYAIRYFHDENLNGKMDTNFVGMPTEGYGFSNNPVGRFGAPPFEKWLFEIKSDTKISLKPTY